MVSRRLLIEILSTFLAEKTHSVISTYAQKYGLENIAVGSNKQERVLNISRYFIDNKDNQEIQDLAFDLIKELIDKEIQILHENKRWYGELESFEEKYPKIYKLLQQDGLSIIDNELKYQASKDINIASSQEEIFILLNKYNFDTPLGHLRQAMDAHANGRWASANSQLRTYVESLFNEMAEQIYGKNKLNNMSSHQKREALSKTKPPIFVPTLNEWDSNGNGFINGFWKRLHPEGPHPGLSDIEDSTFRLHLVFLVTSNILKRFDQ
jgi:hypothetical protein